jgi:hypothetical protein
MKGIGFVYILFGAATIGSCAITTYQCDVYSLASGARVDTVYIDAESGGEAEDICEEDYALADCECYEDN